MSGMERERVVVEMGTSRGFQSGDVADGGSIMIISGFPLVFTRLFRSRTPGGYAVTIFRFDRALEHATPILTFAAPTFARSFAIFRGQFYFGLGTETGKDVKLSEAAGTVLRTPRVH
ncbi:hypothetical protein YP76_20890 [Sphingobium chungbukense]|uniref:Uncharacterized protein n=1 Tax=Sphingobium chungbukense TaxID=56193 RepID=A0A0M3AND0_9SPHN|nr:hypothetical protein YP76_20890 [Sphingobium chungbukense]